MINRSLSQYFLNFLNIKCKLRRTGNGIFQIDTDQTEQIDTTVKLTKISDVTIISDLKAKVGEGKIDNLVGNFGAEDRNNRDKMLVQF